MLNLANKLATPLGLKISLNLWDSTPLPLYPFNYHFSAPFLLTYIYHDEEAFFFPFLNRECLLRLFGFSAAQDVTVLKFLTDGVLLREMMDDPLLTKYRYWPLYSCYTFSASANERDAVVPFSLSWTRLKYLLLQCYNGGWSSWKVHFNWHFAWTIEKGIEATGKLYLVFIIGTICCLFNLLVRLYSVCYFSRFNGVDRSWD